MKKNNNKQSPENAGKAKNIKSGVKAPVLPFVSVCTPTFNRRPFIPIIIECFKNQDYPADRMEWIIVDDGSDSVRDIVESANLPQIKYVHVDKQMSLGKKRNYMHSLCAGDILVYFDDDDYYPPERVSHAVDTLTKNPRALCAGSSEIYVFYKNPSQMVQFGPYNETHATAGTFAIRRELLSMTKYNDHAALAEEKEFLKDYSVPMVQLDPLRTILVFSHSHNTFDKRLALKNSHPNNVRISEKSVDDFIRLPHERKIRDFFMEHIDKMLDAYPPGHPSNKPEVLAQIRDIEKNRQEMIRQHKEQQQQHQQHQQQCIFIERPGEPRVALTSEQIVEIINDQKRVIDKQAQQIEQLQKLNQMMIEKLKNV